MRKLNNIQNIYAFILHQTAANGNEIQSPRLNQFNPENHFGSGWIYISKCEKCCVAGPRLHRIAAAAVKPLADPLWDQDKKFLKSICDNFSSVVILKSINSCFTLYTWSVSAAAHHKNLHASNNCEREIKFCPMKHNTNFTIKIMDTP